MPEADLISNPWLPPASAGSLLPLLHDLGKPAEDLFPHRTRDPGVDALPDEIRVVDAVFAQVEQPGVAEHIVRGLVELFCKLVPYEKELFEQLLPAFVKPVISLGLFVFLDRKSVV